MLSDSIQYAIHLIDLFRREEVPETLYSVLSYGNKRKLLLNAYILNHFSLLIIFIRNRQINYISISIPNLSIAKA